MNYIDMAITIIQSVLFVYFVNYCLEYQKKNIIKLISCVVLITCDGYFIPSIFGNYSISVFVTHILAMLIIVLFFYHKATEAIMAYNIIYGATLIWILIFGNILYGVLEQIIPSGYVEIITLPFMLAIQVILCIFLIIKMHTFREIYKILLSENLSNNYAIIISFIPDFLISFYSITYKKEEAILRDTIIILLIMFIVVNAIYFIKVRERARKIYDLNKSLEIKNNELKKIKNSYGNQILALYHLCMMEQYSDLKSLLKNTINEASNPTEVSTDNKKQESILAYATRHIQSENIKIIINEEANLGLLAISEIELYRIVVNIVNNAVKAMNGEGTLIISSYHKAENIVIEIENDGEMIPKELLDKIFLSGFTTKNNDDKSHGYGLSIVKEVIESYNGKIFVESTKIRTKFIINLPIDNLEVSFNVS